jgi:hypothetical protein
MSSTMGSDLDLELRLDLPHTPRHPRPLLHASVGLLLLASTAFVACGKKLTKDECGHLLGHGVGLIAYPSAEVVPVDVDNLHARAKGEVKRAIDEFDRACIGADESDQILCARRAKSSADFVACGPLTKKAYDTGTVAQLAIVKKHTVDECSKYADHGVKVGATSVDDVSKLVHECDTWMEIGTYRCRLGAKDAAAWNACE